MAVVKGHAYSWAGDTGDSEMTWCTPMVSGVICTFLWLSFCIVRLRCFGLKALQLRVIFAAW